ncbi:conserved hypothetical protein [Gluconacetobacter diazotrophicus PA1 5]|uniref:Glycosyltransferase RgtA/B/C/D-like domain-containing protein n=2 Tax=Gluconacetobacter diazotrophicus TaxID=33996 RepID=A0A7W4FDK8_GLUDI|nr:hypothetical protein [Gluconacetobacter diazotrophicus]ACI50546.1 conserved hypothetical protein [Gluconacetobacter diazotrophicus PA1 5]MBB2155739.1 hypothetical protein [Gluconacetobacter diazotrophicus]TWB09378.1 hypothetical protein FBZ86_10440 [Gluconacetobacter diazotrophicus]CAP56456.1 putative membrane protein [Gluconacetobacter diazotrophicus PA1 5]
MTISLPMHHEAALETHRASDWRVTLGIVLWGTLLSLISSQYAGGQVNNFYHLPILAGLYNEPQFADDLFIQSLRFYSSGFWQILSGTINGPQVFGILFFFLILSRMLLFAGMLAWASLLGFDSVRERIVFTTLVAFASILQGYAEAGAGGLLIDSFTQSEVANATTLIALAWAARRRIGAAFAINGVTFFLNAFVAVWTAVPLAFILWRQWRRKDWTLRTLGIQAAPGLACFVVLAVPVVRNMLANPYVTVTPPFDYIAFLEAFFPYHFLVWDISIRDKVIFPAMFCSGMLAAMMLRRPNAFLTTALWGAIAVWVTGAVLPFATHSRMLLNLHLLRSGTTVYMLAAIAVAALTTRWVFSRNTMDRTLWAPALMLASCTLKILAPFMLLVLLLRRRPWRFLSNPRLSVMAPVLLLMTILFCGVRIYHTMAFDHTFLAKRADWQALGTWARIQTPVRAMFLIPIDLLPEASLLPKGDAGQNELAIGNTVFSYFSHRRAWVFPRAGANVLWAPAYYPEWHDRMVDVRRLKSLPDRLRYADRHGMSYVVDGCGQSDSPVPVAQFSRLCVFAVPQHSAA